MCLSHPYNLLYKPIIYSRKSTQTSELNSLVIKILILKGKRKMSSTIEIETSISTACMFNAPLLEWHNLTKKHCPDHIKSHSVVHGDSTSVESVRQINFTPSIYKKKCM